MKLRIRAQTIRLRLSRAEVEAVSRGEAISCELRLGATARLRYVFSPSDEVSAPALASALPPGVIDVRWPAEVARAWADDASQVSLRAELNPDAETTLSALVEKDFQCLRPRDGEEDRDTFAHPRAGDEVC